MSQKNFHRGQECDECGTASNDALPLAVSISDTFHTAGCMALVQVFRGIAAILTVPCAILSLTQTLLRPSLSLDQCNTIPFALSKWVFITLPGLFSILALRRLNMWKTRRAKPEDSHKNTLNKHCRIVFEHSELPRFICADLQVALPLTETTAAWQVSFIQGLPPPGRSWRAKTMRQKRS